MVRRFLVLGHTQDAAIERPPDDPVAAGRWDVLARAVASVFLLSNGIRRDAEAYIVLLRAQPPRTLILKGAELKHLHPDDRSIQGLLTKALSVKTVGKHPAESTPGVYAASWTLEDALERMGREGPVVLLHEMGLLLEKRDDLERMRGATFVLSDHEEFSAHQLGQIRAAAQSVHSLGPLSLHTSSCIAILHNLLDRLASAR